MRICISSGHAKYVRGASGYPVPPQHDEVDEARKLVETIADKLREAGVEVETYHDNVSTSQGENLERICDWHNGQGAHEYDVSVHLNAFDDSSANGVEVLYVTQETLAGKMSAAIASAGHFTNRGGKYRSDLKFLNSTAAKSVLVETYFCTNTNDCNLAREHYDAICEAIAESFGVEVPDEPDVPERPPIDWPPEFPPPDSEENKLEMILRGYGDMLVTINGQRYQVGDQPENCPRADLRLVWTPGMVVTINGQDYRAPIEVKGIQRNIYATTFGGAADNEHSSYPPYDSADQGPYLDDEELYVALPWAVDDAEVRERGVRVYYRPTGKSIVAAIRDKGPWMVTDNYVATSTRPIAETCCNTGTPLPSGPNAGKVPSNPAGIDLSPAAMDALGMDDNDNVDWMFVGDAVA